MEIELEGCDIKGGWHGVSVRSQATCTLNSCRVYENQWNGISATGEGTTLTLIKGSMIKDNGRCGVSVSAGVQTVIDGCVFEGNGEAGVEAYGKETRLQLDNNSFSANEEAGVRGSRGVMIYLMNNNIVDDNDFDATCLVMKEGLRQVHNPELSA